MKEIIVKSLFIHKLKGKKVQIQDKRLHEVVISL